MPSLSLQHSFNQYPTYMSDNSGIYLINKIKEIQATVGDGLSDEELTRLLMEMALPEEFGFHFLSVSNRYVMFTVPRQNLDIWFSEMGTLSDEKERIAQSIAQKHHFSLYIPSDWDTTCWHYGSDCKHPNHHLEFSRSQETRVIAHPFYVKILLFEKAPGMLFSSAMRIPIQFNSNILSDLAELYEPSKELSSTSTQDSKKNESVHP